VQVDKQHNTVTVEKGTKPVHAHAKLLFFNLSACHFMADQDENYPNYKSNSKPEPTAMLSLRQHASM
jgi:hypothetical protein